MSQTDTRPGFRLPWTAERGESGAPPEDAVGESPAEGDHPVAEETETPQMIDATDAPETTVGHPVGSRRPTKFLADLSHAMQVAAETARDETMARFETEAKTAVEEVNAKAAEEAASLRRQADDDVSAIRDWSKAEIARIRGETEARIASRKIDLDEEIEAHAGVVTARVDRVGTAVSGFQAEMGEFFERLLAEEDPTRIATMAETMPDPPSLAEVVASMATSSPSPFHVVRSASYGSTDGIQTVDAAEALAAAEAYRGLEPATVIDSPSDGSGATDAVPSDTGAEAAEGTSTEATAETTTTVEGATPEAAEGASSEATAEGATAEGATAEGATAEGATAEGVTAEADFAAAEAEALAFTGDLEDEPAAGADDHNPGLPAEPEAHLSRNGGRATTRVVVLGLVSVASIATFKRSLGRVPGVSAIGVASGPDGEFVFTVSHDSELNLADAITALPGFEAKVTSQNADGLEVAAHDPDAAT